MSDKKKILKRSGMDANGAPWFDKPKQGEKTARDTRGCIYIQTCQCATGAVIVVVVTAWRGARYSSPTYPRTSTFENATVGVGGAPRPMNERVRPFE